MTNPPLEECDHGLLRGTCSICSGLDERRARDPRHVSTCTACGAEIQWCKTDLNGRAISIDVEPDPEGRWVKVRVEPSGDRIVHCLRHDELGDPRPRHTCHFDTCEARKETDR